MKKYEVIYADPPWQIKKIKRKVRPNQIKMDYPTMPLEEIKTLPISKIAEENSVLFLWTIQSFLPKAFEVMTAWGFKYKLTATWDKGNGSCLFGFHYRTEFLLFGSKGKLSIYPKRKTFPTVISAKSERHSHKPQIFRTLIAPFGDKRIELFAREKVQGWDSWGNEVDSDVEI
jgi:N6-adenosine-specific RNA methylase IME4